MSLFSGISASFKALSWFQGAAGIASLGFLGPIPAILAGLVQLVWKAIKIVLAGITDIVASPPRAVAAVTIAMVTFFIGLHYGKGWDAWMVVAANANANAAKLEVANLESKLKAEEEADTGKAKAAKEARDAAKKLAPIATGSVDKPARAKRVRTGAGSASNSGAVKSGLFGF